MSLLGEPRLTSLLKHTLVLIVRLSLLHLRLPLTHFEQKSLIHLTKQHHEHLCWMRIRSLDFFVQIWYPLLKYRIYGGTNTWQSLLFSSSLRGVVALFRAFPGCYLPRSTLRVC